MEDPKSIQRRFEAALKVIQSLPKDGSYDLSDEMLVMFYSYYKQATTGPCNTPKPNSWDPIDDSDDEMYSDSMENTATQEKGSGVHRVHLADVSVTGANTQQGGHREPQCGSQDGKPQRHLDRSRLTESQQAVEEVAKYIGQRCPDALVCSGF